jgi:hypothetical protein
MSLRFCRRIRIAPGVRRDPVKPIPNKKPAGIIHDGDCREPLAAPHRRFESLDFVLIQEHGWFQLEV